MITAAQQSDWLLHHLSQSAGNLPGRGLAWLEHLRREAARSVAQLPVLNRKQESWRYTSIDNLLQQRTLHLGQDAALAGRRRRDRVQQAACAVAVAVHTRTASTGRSG